MHQRERCCLHVGCSVATGAGVEAAVGGGGGVGSGDFADVIASDRVNDSALNGSVS